MFNLELGFDKPWYLLLLLLLPAIWLWSYHSLAGLGKIRRLVAIGLRSLVVLLIVFALAEVQLLRTSEKLTVIYLLDQSESIPLAKRHSMIRYVSEEVRKHRNSSRQDRAGVIVFGADAMIEVPPFDDDIHTVGNMESLVDLSTNATNLAAALKLAQASFPEDTAKRIVIVSDGNENLGNASSIAHMLADDEIGIDVVPVELEASGEVDLEKLTLPSDIRKGQPIQARAVLNNYTDRPVPGRLKITRRIGPQEELLVEEAVTLDPGKNIFPVTHTIDQPAVYDYRASFTPDNPADDLMSQNNETSAFTHVRGQGRILLIEDADNKGEFDFLVERLMQEDLEVIVQGSDELFSSLQELQGYDCVILANTPRSSGSSADSVSNFSNEQITMLVRNTEQFGAGLLMLGGPNSFGAGGWANTDLEKAMPVDFQIKNTKVRAVGALVLMMHASEMARGNHWQKVVGQEAINALGPMDYCGLIHWNDFSGGDSWLWGGKTGLVRVGQQKKLMVSRLGRMTPGDMPQFEPAMKMALAGFNRVNASAKHMIVISDGDPSPPTGRTINAYKSAKIQVTTVAVGTHGAPGSTPLQNIATATGGKYYVVTNPKALPKIYQREARRVSRPLVKDLNNVPPVVTFPHEILQGVEDSLPPLKGFVMTTLKDSSLVDQVIVSPDPDQRKNATILASWQYGAGRSVAFTTDAGERWADQWTGWEGYDKLFSQMVRWAMRPSKDQGNFTIATEVKDGKVRVVIDALDKDDQFINFLNMSANVVDSDMEVSELKIQQTYPGRYEGEFPAPEPGTYFLTVSTGTDGPPLFSGVSVPYSTEFSDRDANLALLSALASLQPDGGEAGAVIEGEIASEDLDPLLKWDTFRHNLRKAISIQDVWPLFLLVCAAIFFADVFVRRVSVGFEWVAPAVAWVRAKVFGVDSDQAEDARLDRLRSRKQAVAQNIDQRRAAARFEPQADEDAPTARELDEVIRDVSGSAPSGPPRPAAPQSSPGEPTEDDDYTSRLLQAKKKAWKDKPKEN